MQLIQSNILNSYSNLKHGFITRDGGNSSGIFSGFNFSFSSQDKVADIQSNYDDLASFLGIAKDKIITIRQVHSDIIIDFDSKSKLGQRNYVGDAILTKENNVAISVGTADCVPIIFFAEDIGYIGVVHAGWRGAFLGIVEKFIAKLCEYGASKKSIIACIMPSIAKESYEVDHNFFQKFIGKDFLNQRFFSDRKKGCYLFDLRAFVESKLKNVKVENVSLDTYSNEEKCFSCRRAFHKKEKSFGGHLSFVMKVSSILKKI